MSTEKRTVKEIDSALSAPVQINTVAAQDVKRRGVRAIVEKLDQGPVHVLQHNRPTFVALREEHYSSLVEEIDAARIRLSLADLAEGRVKTVTTAELMGEILAD